MDPVVGPQVDPLDGDPGDAPGRVLADGGQHGAVMVGIHVAVQQVPTARLPQRVEDHGVPPLAHVQDALQHSATSPAK